MEGRSRAPSGNFNDGLDPTLFALATVLPMSCFPIDNVKPCERYGVPGQKSCRVSKTSRHAKSSCNYLSSTSFTAQNHYQDNYGLDDKNLFNLVPSLCASTLSADWTSNWSYGEAATCFKDPVSFGIGDASLVARNGYSNASLDRDYPIDGLDSLAQNRVGFARDELAPLEFAPKQGPRLVQFLEGCNPCDVFSSTLSMHGSGGEILDKSYGFRGVHLPPDIGASPLEAPPLDPALPRWTGYPSPDHSSHCVEQEVDDFLKELGDSIDWDNIAPSSDDSHDNEMATLLSRYTNDRDVDALISSRDLYPELDLDPRSTFTCSQDVSERGIPDEATESPSEISALLEECSPYLPESSTLEL